MAVHESTATATRPETHGPTPQVSTFTAFWLLQRRADAPSVSSNERDRLATAVDDLLGEHEGNATLRGAYSTAGLCAGVDLILWVTADDCESLHRLAASLMRTEAGARLTMRHVYLGVASMSQYDPNHGPAFMRELAPRKYLSVYPFTKTHDWYLLPFEERRDLMIEHGRMGQEFPSILTNTVNSFGIADQEFIVALEDDDPAVLVRMVQRLRAAEVRKYTAVDTPIFLGLLKPLAEAVADAL
jgi:peroxiredoxin